MMCFCSMKFHYFVKSLPFLNLNFLKETIEDICGYSWIIARSRIKIIEDNNSFSLLTEKKMNYLTIISFLKILKKKQKKYVDLILWLENILKLIDKNLKEELEKVTNEIYSKDLFKIKF